MQNSRLETLATEGLFWRIVSQIFGKEAQRYRKCLLFVVGKNVECGQWGNVVNGVNGVPELVMGWIKTRSVFKTSDKTGHHGPIRVCHPERSEGTDQANVRIISPGQFPHCVRDDRSAGG